MTETLKQMVEQVLEAEPETRNSDLALTIAIWQLFYAEPIRDVCGQDAVCLKDLYDLPRQADVQRYRAMFNQDGRFFPTRWEVAKNRGIKEDAWRVALGYPPSEPVVQQDLPYQAGIPVIS